MIDFWSKIICERFNRPEGWQWCKLDAHNKPEDFVEVTGGVPIRKLSRGPRKGSPVWGTGLDVFFVRQSEIEQARKQWEAENGVCSTCEGTGVFGRQESRCYGCKGSGKPQVAK